VAYLSTEIKNKALLNIAEDLLAKADDILEATRRDYEEASAPGMSAAMLDRLLLTTDRLKAMAQDVRSVAALPDPVGEVTDMRTLPNGLIIGKSACAGFLGAIYESPQRHHLTSSLCAQYGNALSCAAARSPSTPLRPGEAVQQR
jgi:glutamate-5-semialdehyde dehydrogenase